MSFRPHRTVSITVEVPEHIDDNHVAALDAVDQIGWLCQHDVVVELVHHLSPYDTETRHFLVSMQDDKVQGMTARTNRDPYGED